ncbi:MAG: membrane protein insertase YidC [Thermodesulfovibrionales bacterium]|nr:membrane protein insertase YidC [Thermodesulfovibrionales bacterium]
MEKRAVIFVVLSVAVLIVFQYFFAPQPTEQGDSPKGVVSEPGQAPVPQSPEAQAPVPHAPEAVVQDVPVRSGDAEQLVTVETDLFRAVLSSRGGTVRSFVLKEYFDEAGQPLTLLEDSGMYRALSIGSDNDFSISNQNFQIEGADLNLKSPGRQGSVSFSLITDNYTIKRTYTFTGGTYGFDLTDRVEGLPGYRIALGTDLGIHDRKDRYAHVGPVVLVDAKRKQYTAGKLKKPKAVTGNIKWIALEDKYFFAALVPAGPMASADLWSYKDVPAVSLSGRPGEQSFYVYVGPKRRYELMDLDKGLEAIVDFGFFSMIAIPIFWLLKELFAITGNYGWSIILLTLIIRIPFLPLVSKSQRSMKKMQMVQPKVKDIRDKYKKNPEKMNAEVMALYKKYKVNPLGGCLPLLLQLPVFFALYKVLLAAIELRSAPWVFWIVDLSIKDPYYVLPLVMGVSMFFQMKMTPSAGDPKQQKIMQLMPVIFTFMFLWFPSGLVLYWLVNNMLAIGQQYYINKSMKDQSLEEV